MVILYFHEFWQISIKFCSKLTDFCQIRENIDVPDLYCFSSIERPMDAVSLQQQHVFPILYRSKLVYSHSFIELAKTVGCCPTKDWKVMGDLWKVVGCNVFFSVHYFFQCTQNPYLAPKKCLSGAIVTHKCFLFLAADNTIYF